MKDKKPYGMGYIEYLAVKHEVDELREKGYRFSLIHKKLQDEGKITMSYESFSRYASGRNRPYGTACEPARIKDTPKDKKVESSTPPKTIKPDVKQNEVNTEPKKAERILYQWQTVWAE